MSDRPHLVPLVRLPGVREHLNRDFAATFARNADCRRALRARWGKPDEIRKLTCGNCALLWRIKRKGRIYVVAVHPHEGASYAVQDARGALDAARDPKLGRDACAFLKEIDAAIAEHEPEEAFA